MVSLGRLSLPYTKQSLQRRFFRFPVFSSILLRDDQCQVASGECVLALPPPTRLQTQIVTLFEDCLRSL